MYFSAPRRDLQRIYGIELEHDRFYVVDAVGSAGIISGPHPTRQAAEADRAERSIAEDCDIVRAA